MAVDVKNIIVGAGDLFIAERTGGAKAADPDFAVVGQTAFEIYEGDANWTHLGATEGGVELSYEPTYTDINIDQFKDAARLFLETQTVNVSTTLMESTLANLVYVWGFEASTHYTSAAFSTTDGKGDEFSLGILGEDPCEYSLAVVAKGIGVQPNCIPGTEVERIYVANRVVSVTGSTFGLRRTESTMFPVTFRLLPDADAAVNKEYAEIFDRDSTAVTGV